MLLHQGSRAGSREIGSGEKEGRRMNNTTKAFGGLAILFAVGICIAVCRDNRPKPPTPTPPAPPQTATPTPTTGPVVYPTPPPVPTGTPPVSTEPVLPVTGHGGLLNRVDGPPPPEPCPGGTYNQYGSCVTPTQPPPLGCPGNPDCGFVVPTATQTSVQGPSTDPYAGCQDIMCP